MEYFAEILGKSYRSAPILEKLFKTNNWGKKTGKGYYDWTDGKTNEISMNDGVSFDPLRILASGVNEAAKLIEQGDAARNDIDIAVILGLAYHKLKTLLHVLDTGHRKFDTNKGGLIYFIYNSVKL